MQNTTLCPASSQQLKMIIGLSWDLRKYYSYNNWQNLRSGIISIAFNKALMKECSQLIKRMLTILKEKQTIKAKKYWIREEYDPIKPTYQKNIAKMALSFFPDEATYIKNIQPHQKSEWLKLKNRIERLEQFYSCLSVRDDTWDNRPSLAEEERWKQSNRCYSELVEGIDFLEPTPGIDSEKVFSEQHI